jgi:foldase protein PrsA
VITRVAALLALVAIAVSAGCGGGGEGDGGGAPEAQDVPDGAVAVVSDTTIPRADFDRFFEQAKVAAEARGETFPAVGTPEYEQLRREAIDLLVSRAVFRKEAQALGITVADQEVTDRLDELKQQYYQGDEQRYEQELKSLGLTEEDIRAELETQLLNQKLFDEVTKDVSVTDEDVRKYYDENRDRFRAPDSREVAHILVDTKKKAQELYAELEAGADFAELAKDNSTDESSAQNGGQLPDPARKDGSLVPEFEKVAFELATGEISKPVKSEYGWHIIKALTDTKPASTTPFDQVEKDIREQLLQEKRNAAMTEWVTDTRAKYASETSYATGFEPAGVGAATTGG